MWGRNISLGNQPFNSYMYICCIYFILYCSLFYTSCFVRKRDGPLFLMSNINGASESAMVAYRHKYAKG